mmetsp:Transcript_43940/g.73188  ORF Transcript_43940/g.73188 Transcript_43940/m.73188 type:complete len:145 (-) Transcript_43940:722-1156(-)
MAPEFRSLFNMHVHAVGNGTSSAAGAEGTVAKELEEAKKKLRACFSVKSFPSFYTDEIVDCWANANVSGTHPDLANQWEIPPPALHKRLNRFVLGSTTRGAEGNVCQTTPLATGVAAPQDVTSISLEMPCALWPLRRESRTPPT